MARLDTGRFIITNSKFKNVVYLADPNSCSDLHGDRQKNRPGEMWNIVLLSNGNYTIRNYGYSSYATCEYIAKPDAKPDVGNNIVGGDHQEQWKIVEERGNYLIFPTKNKDVCWHLADVESTPLTLEKYSLTNKEIQWEFSKVEDPPSTPSIPAVRVPPVRVATSDSDSSDSSKASASSLRSYEISLVMRSIAPGSSYTIRVAGSTQYLGVSFWGNKVDLSQYLLSARWLITRCRDNWQIQLNQLLRSCKYLSIYEDGAARVSDDPTELLLTPVGGPNEFRITEVDSDRSWDGLVIESYE